MIHFLLSRQLAISQALSTWKIIIESCEEFIQVSTVFARIRYQEFFLVKCFSISDESSVWVISVFEEVDNPTEPTVLYPGLYNTVELR